MFVGLWAGLHQVHPLCVDLDQGQDISVPDGLVQNLQPGRVVGTELPGEALLCVLGSDVVLPRLPENEMRSGVSPDQPNRRLHVTVSHSHVTAGVGFGDTLR